MLQLGVGRTNITPKIGGYLFGYSPDTVSTSVNDELTACVFLFKKDKKSTALVNLTVCAVATELSDEIRQKLSEELDVPADFIMVSAIHTHSGPRTDGSAGWGEIDREYCDTILLPGCIKAAKIAKQTLRPVTMGVGTTCCLVGVNRREMGENDEIILGQNDWAVMDKTMSVISFKDESGKPFANMIHYGAHATAAGHNTEISRDWPGVMIDIVERETGALTAFFNGAEGDIGPRLTNGKTVGNIAYAKELGAVAAADAMRAYRSIGEWNDVSLEAYVDDFAIPYKPLMSEKEARERLNEFECVPAGNLPLQIYSTLKQILEIYEKGEKLPQTFHMKQTVMSLGSVLFVPLPFEIFSEISLRLRKKSKYANTLILSNANGSNTYLPTQDQLCRGGYEVGAFLWGSPLGLPENADTLFVNELSCIIEKITR